MFLGQFEHTIDEKGRITFPSRFRELLADGAYLTRGFDQNLTIMTVSRFDKLSNLINNMNSLDSKVRDLQYFIFGNAVKVEFDSAGRFLIPQYLRELAHINGVAAVVGNYETIDIWAPELWAGHTQKFENPEMVTEAFSGLDLSLS